MSLDQVQQQKAVVPITRNSQLASSPAPYDDGHQNGVWITRCIGKYGISFPRIAGKDIECLLDALLCTVTHKPFNSLIARFA